MKIKIVCVGKLKEQFWKDAVTEYSKRLTKYCKLEIKETEQCKSDDPEISRKTEATGIINALEGYVIAAEISGEQLTSLEFSKKIENLAQTHSSITFIIGGSHGLCKSVLQRVDFRMSFSKLTMAHQLFRIVLLEQIYRAYGIANCTPYHK